MELPTIPFRRRSTGPPLLNPRFIVQTLTAARWKPFGIPQLSVRSYFFNKFCSYVLPLISSFVFILDRCILPRISLRLDNWKSLRGYSRWECDRVRYECLSTIHLPTPSHRSRGRGWNYTEPNRWVISKPFSKICTQLSPNGRFMEFYTFV